MSQVIKFEKFEPADIEKSKVMGVKDIVAHAEDIASQIEDEVLDAKRRQIAEELEKVAHVLSSMNERMLVLSLIMKCGFRRYDGEVVRGRELFDFLRARLEEMGMDPESFEHYHTLNDLIDAHGVGSAPMRAASPGGGMSSGIFGKTVPVTGAYKASYMDASEKTKEAVAEAILGKKKTFSEMSDSEVIQSFIDSYQKVQEERDKERGKEDTLPF